MSPPTQSNIWIYFEPNIEDHNKANCKICNKSYSRKGRTTSSLKNHLRSMHPEEFHALENMSKEKQLQKIKYIADEDATPSQELNEQLSFEKAILNENNWDVNDSKKIDKLIGEMIALQNLPFNFVEGLGFRRLMQKLAPQYNIRGCNFFTDFVCNELYGKVAHKVKELIEKFDHMSFTSDIWSDPSSNDSLLSLTCHGITESFYRSSIILKCVTFDGYHTGDIIYEKFSMMFSEWNIKKDQLHCLIRDEGSNMERGVRLAELNYIDCTVHKLQLAIHSCLESQENIKILEETCKKISSHFTHSTVAQKQLQTIQDRLNQPHLKVFQECVSQWNSTFYMFKHFLMIKDALSIYINDHEIKPFLPEQWKIIENFVELLTPFEEATRELSSSHALISSVIPIIQMLERKVDDYLTRSQEFDPIQETVMTLKNELSTKFSSLGDNNLYTIATYLDPRYKHKCFTPVTEEKIKDNILKMVNTQNDVFASPNFNIKGAKKIKMTYSTENYMNQLGPGTSGFDRKTCLQNDLAIMLDSSSEDESEDIPENSTKAIVKRELLSYRNKKRINVYENPLNWWSVHREEFKILSPIVRRFLSAPPGSVPSEQLFSSAGLIFEPLSNRLKSEKAEILLFIKYNAPIFKFTY